MIVFDNEKKDLPIDQLHKLFISAGWSDGKEDDFKYSHFNCPFINSTLVISAWDNEKLVGCVRVISDKIVRSVIEDLVVEPSYQNQGIGKELLKMCLNTFPKSEWIIKTNIANIGYYKKFGFEIIKNDEIVLSIPSQWF